MSLPIPIRSGSASKNSLYDLLQIPASPPTFVMERHACAFPSWPNRPSLSCPSTSTNNGQEAPDYFSELELNGAVQSRVQQLRQPRLRRPSNYLELEFEDDSEDEDDTSSAESSTQSTPCGSQQDHPSAPVKSTASVPNNRCSALSNQLRKYKQSTPQDLRKKIRYNSAVCDD